MADAGQHRAALLFEARPLALELVESLGELVEGAGDVAELVGALDAGAAGAVAGLDASDRGLEALGVAPERRRGDHRQDDGERGRRRQHAEHGPRLVGVEDHQPGQQQGGDGADGQRARA